MWVTNKKQLRKSLLIHNCDSDSKETMTKFTKREEPRDWVWDKVSFFIACDRVIGFSELEAKTGSRRDPEGREIRDFIRLFLFYLLLQFFLYHVDGSWSLITWQQISNDVVYVNQSYDFFTFNIKLFC